MNAKIFYLMFMFVFFIDNLNVHALSYGGCEYSDVSNMKSFVSNINLSYDYNIKDNEAYFNITISNLIPDIYFVDSVSKKEYHYDDSINGEITIYDYKNTSGQYRFYSNRSECRGIKLGNKYYNLPSYNIFYNDPLCQSNRSYSLCQKWVKANYTYGEFKQMLADYNSEQQTTNQTNNIVISYKNSFLDNLVKFYTEYYHVILSLIIIVCVIIMIINKKRNRFNL